MACRSGSAVFSWSKKRPPKKNAADNDSLAHIESAYINSSTHHQSGKARVRDTGQDRPVNSYPGAVFLVDRMMEAVEGKKQLVASY